MINCSHIRIFVVLGGADSIASYPEYPYVCIRRGRKEAVVFVVAVVGRFWEGRVDVVQEEKGPSVFVFVKFVQAVDREIYA